MLSPSLKPKIELPQPALLKIKFLTSNKNVYNMLNSIKTEPLYRIFARYPTSLETTPVLDTRAVMAEGPVVYP